MKPTLLLIDQVVREIVERLADRLEVRRQVFKIEVGEDVRDARVHAGSLHRNGARGGLCYARQVAKRKPGKKKTAIAHHEIVTMSVESLNPAAYNPRFIDKPAKAGLGASLKKFGMLQPIVWNKRSGNIVGGHKRLELLIENEIEETQVVVVDMDDAAEKAANLTLNNPGITGVFTDDLPDVLSEVRDVISLEDFMALRLDVLDVPPPKDLALDSSLSYAIQIGCATEVEQRQLIVRLEGEGLKCKPLIW